MLARQGDLSAFLSKASAKGGASSGACAVLVTDKASTPSVFKALAAEFGERLGFAAARKGAVELVSELGLSRCAATCTCQALLAHASQALQLTMDLCCLLLTIGTGCGSSHIQLPCC